MGCFGLVKAAHPVLLRSQAKMGLKEGCCQFCFIMSCVAVPLMFFFGYLCKSNSPMIELKDEMKADAGSGCYMAGLMYLVTIFVSYGIVNAKDESTSAREIHIASDNNKAS